NRDLKADLVSAASERDRMRQQLIEVRAKAAELEDGRATRAAVPQPAPAPQAPTSIPAVWKGPRCLEEARGSKCPAWVPVFGHDAPCLTGEKRIELTIPSSDPTWTPTAGWRPWCKPG